MAYVPNLLFVFCAIEVIDLSVLPQCNIHANYAMVIIILDSDQYSFLVELGSLSVLT